MHRHFALALLVAVSALLLLQTDAGATGGSIGGTSIQSSSSTGIGVMDDRYLNDDSDDTTTGKVTITKDPASGTCVNASFVVNPATSAANEFYMCLADNGTRVLSVDKEGDAILLGDVLVTGGDINDSTPTARFTFADGAGTTVTTEAAAAGTGLIVNNTTAFTTGISAAFRSNDTEIARIEGDGDVQCDGTVTSAGTGTSAFSGTLQAPTINSSGGNGYLHNGTSTMLPSGGSLGASPWVIRGYVAASGGTDVAVATDTLNSLAAADYVHSFRNAGTEGARVEAAGNIQCDGNLTVDGTGTSAFAGAVTVATSVTIASGTAITASLAVSGTIDFASIASQNCLDASLTLTGAAINDPTACSYPSGMTEAVSGTCWVRSANAVTFRLCNGTVAAIDPASGTFAARIIR